jgi:hypothetical protein
MDKTRGVRYEKEKQTNFVIAMHWCYTNGSSNYDWHETGSGKESLQQSAV